MLRRISRIVGILFVVLIGSGAIYQVAASRGDADRYPMPGEVVNAGEHELHLRVMGEGDTTVVLEAGLGSMAAQWLNVQPELAQHTRVVAYDRAGMGWSAQSDQPKDAAHIADQLYTALQNADIGGPYLVVGHSIGGLYVRVFADRYADEVVGMVLVDASHTEQFDRIDDFSEPSGRFERIVGGLAHIGAPRLIDPSRFLLPEDAPEEMKAAFRKSFSSPAYWSELASETANWSVSEDQARAAGDFGDLPLAVVLADNDAPEHWQALQAEHADLSTSGTLRTIHGADHLSIVSDPEHAMGVVDAILEVLDASAQMTATNARD
jgi:pimeloyl-ACP methyl ester carboxylesterase